ncbi:MAG: UvrD-helicase domain-containing protein [bacterium]
MKFIADLHIHSHFSIATSKNLVPEHLHFWARKKGITVVGTGDFTHPGWLGELKEKLEPAEQGLFKLKEQYRLNDTFHIPSPIQNDIRFILTAEISNIYKKGDCVRKVHNVIFAPSFEVVEKIQNALAKIGNITSDGRPILGLDSRDLLEIVLEASENIFFVPAHIWTPWFSALGSKSGFDSIEACYGDLSPHISAVETGLSSDPAMNWMCSFLDKYTLLSNSDAHSPEKLGREANFFDTALSYDAIIQAIREGDPERFLGTVEFFPQEGKYHYDGHRKCGICWDPVQTLKHQALCPVCGKSVTIGVMNRVAQLSDRQDPTQRQNPSPFYSLIPLKEILSEIAGVGPNAKQVVHAYSVLIQKLGSELDVLLHLPVDEIARRSNPVLAEAIRRMRAGEVIIKEGYDGEYGIVHVFNEDESKSFSSQDSLFDVRVSERRSQYKARRPIAFDLVEYRHLKERKPETPKERSEPTPAADKSDPLHSLNAEQRKAAEHASSPALILAGPGTGKTLVLTHRIAHLLQKRSVSPENILAVTFTNKAAGEMKERLARLVSDDEILSRLTVSTFHAFGHAMLKEQSAGTGRTDRFLVFDREDTERILRKELGCPQKSVRKTADAIADLKQTATLREEIEDADLADLFEKYETFLISQNAFDLDDLIYQPLLLFTKFLEILAHYQKKVLWILVDEYQDINAAQYKFVRQLMPAQDANIFVIGDPNQAIYGFRGADVRFIQRFRDDYPHAAVYRLQTSYRCTGSILKASSSILRSTASLETRNSKSETSESLLEGLQEGVKINISHQPSDKSEAEFVARTIERLMGGLRFFSIDSAITDGDASSHANSLSDFAVLCRIHQQMKAVEKAFHDHSIPYQTVGDVPFFKQAAVRDILDILKLAVHPENQYLKSRLVDSRKSIPQNQEFLNTLVSTSDSVEQTLSGIADRFFTKDDTMDENAIKKLLSLARPFGSDSDGFLRFAALGSAVDTHQHNVEAVTLITLHAAKGLEFECVFITGCEDGLLPYRLFESQECDPEEERRLLYVGMTRAKKILFLSHADKRFLMGREHSFSKSPFLHNIEEELVEESAAEYRRKPKKTTDQLGLFPT